MSRHYGRDVFIGDVLREVEGELEAETEKLSFKWVVSRSLGFGEGYEIVNSLSTGSEQHTRNDALARQSAVIQMAYKKLKNSGAHGRIKVERFIQDGATWKKDRSRDDDACSKADLDAPYLKITGCWP
jgi:hypothetical protein